MLVGAAFDADWPAMERLLALEASVEHVDPHGQTALMGAAWEGNLGMVRRLVELGAEVPRKDRTRRKASAVDYAELGGHRVIAAYLRKLMAAGEDQ